jgi:hypothetical protein
VCVIIARKLVRFNPTLTLADHLFPSIKPYQP